MSTNLPIAWTTEALEQHLADEAKARRRRACEVRPKTDRWSKKSKDRDNRAAGKRNWKREYA